jgi:hypothetical protein
MLCVTRAWREHIDLKLISFVVQLCVTRAWREHIDLKLISYVVQLLKLKPGTKSNSKRVMNNEPWVLKNFFRTFSCNPWLITTMIYQSLIWSKIIREAIFVYSFQSNDLHKTLVNFFLTTFEICSFLKRILRNNWNFVKPQLIKDWFFLSSIKQS